MADVETKVEEPKEPTFADLLTQKSKEALDGNLEASNVLHELVATHVEAFKSSCEAAAAEGRFWAECTVDQPLPAGLTVEKVLEAGTFHRLLDAEFNKLDLRCMKVSWSCYYIEKLQKAVTDEAGLPVYKWKEDKSNLPKLEKLKLNVFEDVTEWPEVKPFKKAVKEQVLKEVDGPGAHLKVEMSANWPKPVDPDEEDPDAVEDILKSIPVLYYTYSNSSARASPDITRNPVPVRIVTVSLDDQREETPRRIASSPSKLRGA